jgi:CspA family cold shock protein
MATGSIKRLVRDRGFGFIKVENGPDVFFHRSHVRDASFDALEEGLAVEFEPAESDKGPRAAWVKLGAAARPQGDQPSSQAGYKV